MGSDVKINIDHDKIYTSNDVISGIVTLNVKSSLSLTGIEVKLQGVSSTMISFNDIRNRGKQKFITDVHRLLYETIVVFPPQNVRDLSQATEFTLTQGVYNYPFTFTLPTYANCDDGKGSPRFKFVTSNSGFQAGYYGAQLRSNAVNYSANLVSSVGGHLTQSSSRIGNAVGNYINNATTNIYTNEYGQLVSDYHNHNKLPPSFSNASGGIEYFVKVTCRRSSFFKTNLRSKKPFKFSSLDDPPPERIRESFLRKELTFKNRLPGGKQKNLPPAPERKGFFQRIFDSSSLNPPQIQGGKDVLFMFEVRFSSPATLPPSYEGQSPFKVFLIIDNPAPFITDGKSNGLGVIYFQKFVVDLRILTFVSAPDYLHGEIQQVAYSDVIDICDNTYENLEFDLANATPIKSTSSTGIDSFKNYELEIPSRYFTNFKVPALVPSFITCNIQRKYILKIVGGFSADKIRDLKHGTVNYVDLVLDNIIVPSKYDPPPKEDIPMYSNSSDYQIKPEKASHTGGGEGLSDSDLNLQQQKVENHLDDQGLPSYVEVVGEPNDS